MATNNARWREFDVFVLGETGRGGAKGRGCLGTSADMQGRRALSSEYGMHEVWNAGYETGPFTLPGILSNDEAIGKHLS